MSDTCRDGQAYARGPKPIAFMYEGVAKSD